MTGLMRMGRAEPGHKFRECVDPMIPFNQHQYIREEGLSYLRAPNPQTNR